MGPVSPRFVFFGGKGGVGKTTCAAAYALAAARRHRVLVVSIDAAHSLADALSVRLSSRVSRVTGRLDALELNADRALDRWLRQHRPGLGEALEHGTWLAREDVDAFLDLPIPGIDELMAMLEITRLAGLAPALRRSRASTRDRHASESGRKGFYDEIVIDTAPTGHTLRMLAAPQTVAAVAAALDALQREHRTVRARFGGIDRPDPADRLIELLARQASLTRSILEDSRRSCFRWVMHPEELSFEQSRQALAVLDEAAIRVEDVVINRVLPDGPPCRTCDPRRHTERQLIRRIRSTFRHRRVLLLPAESAEPKGIARLRKLGGRLVAPGRVGINPDHLAVWASRVGRGTLSRAHENEVTDRRPARPKVESDIGLIPLLAGKRLVFVGGKGGVGKSTVAAAASLALAKDVPAKRVLLISTDPAHSLGNVLNMAAGDESRAVDCGPPNLRVREVDAAVAFRQRRALFEAAFAEIASGLGVDGGSRDMVELLDLAPPGIDELFGILAVQASLDEQDGADLIVVDTAPTGHALRLLEMPEVARAWVQALMRVLLKYRAVMTPGPLGAELVELARSIRTLQELTQTPASTSFLVVTRAARVPSAETERLLRQLRRFGLSVPALVVNALTRNPGRCGWCLATAKAERRQLQHLVRAARRGLNADRQARAAGRKKLVIIQTSLVAPPPRGAAALQQLARSWTYHDRLSVR